MPGNKFSHAMSEAAPVAKGVYDFAVPQEWRDYAHESVYGPEPSGIAPVGTDFAARTMAPYGDASSAGTLVGVNPRMRPLPRPAAPVQGQDIYIGGDAPAPAPPPQPLRQFAPVPNFSRSARTNGVV